jgi:hypothetical protein
MEHWLVGFIWVLNFVISIWNAYACGKAWVEAKHAGGWPRFMCWMGALMSASGFTWCYLILLALIAYHFDWLKREHVLVALQLGYIVIIPGVLFSGLMITVDSWAQTYRSRRLRDLGLAAYNTYAQLHNTFNAIQDFGSAFTSVVDFFTRGKSGDHDDDDGGGVALLIVAALVLIALFGGVLTTALIINRVAGNYPLPPPPQQQPDALVNHRQEGRP